MKLIGQAVDSRRNRTASEARPILTSDSAVVEKRSCLLFFSISNCCIRCLVWGVVDLVLDVAVRVFLLLKIS